MALTAEQKTIQSDTLTSAIDENENMKYKTNPAMNKGVSSEYFGTGSATKPVNILNALYKKAEGAEQTATSVYNTFAGVILDTSSGTGAAKFEEMKSATGQNTLIESVTAMSKDIKELKENSESSGGGTSSGIIINILEEPTDEEEQPETCEHEYVEGVCTKCGEAEPTNGSDGT